MNRSSITKKKTKRTSTFDREFEKMKPIIKARSGGRCEADLFAMRWVMAFGTVGLNDVGVPIAVEPWNGAWVEFINRLDDCTTWATEVHHRRYRGKSRGGSNAESNLIHLCDACHDWIHAHGGQGGAANILGLALSSWSGEELPEGFW